MCDTLVAVGPETAAGAALFAKNSDRPRAECQPFVQLPALDHAPGSTLRCTHIEIPQVERTHAVMGHSPWWIWGFEHGVNEHGVAIGNELVFSNEELEPEPGLIGMDLVRLGLERGRTAREALAVMTQLLETHGQGGPALGPNGPGYSNGFLIADASEAWVLETSNRRWAARRVTLASISNHISLGSDWELGSKDLEAFARERGLWNGEGRLDVAAAYRNARIPGRISEGRQCRSQALLEAARGRLDVAGLQTLLRDHADGTIFTSAASPEDERYFTLCSHNDVQGPTTASLVAPLPPSPATAWPVWISFATPCTGVFLPVYSDGILPAALARGGEKPEPDSAWWTFRALQEAAAPRLPDALPALRRAWDELEERVERERPRIESAARRAFAAGQVERAERELSDFMQRVWHDAMERARALRAELGD